jgi:hypothetical protein
MTAFPFGLEGSQDFCSFCRKGLVSLSRTLFKSPVLIPCIDIVEDDEAQEISVSSFIVFQY